MVKKLNVKKIKCKYLFMVTWSSFFGWCSFFPILIHSKSNIICLEDVICVKWAIKFRKGATKKINAGFYIEPDFFFCDGCFNMSCCN